MKGIFKEAEGKLELLTDIDMLLMVEKGIRGWICHEINQYEKATKNIWKIMIKIKNHNILNIGIQIIYIIGQCRKSFQ